MDRVFLVNQKKIVFFFLFPNALVSDVWKCCGVKALYRENLIPRRWRQILLCEGLSCRHNAAIKACLFGCKTCKASSPFLHIYIRIRALWKYIASGSRNAIFIAKVNESMKIFLGLFKMSKHCVMVIIR